MRGRKGMKDINGGFEMRHRRGLLAAPKRSFRLFERRGKFSYRERKRGFRLIRGHTSNSPSFIDACEEKKKTARRTREREITPTGKWEGKEKRVSTKKHSEGSSPERPPTTQRDASSTPQEGGRPVDSEKGGGSFFLHSRSFRPRSVVDRKRKRRGRL